MKSKVLFPTDTATTPEITDKRGYGERWHFSVRHVDNLLAMGLPHLKIGARRVRILIDEADAWMRERFSTQRRGPTQTTANRQSEPAQKGVAHVN